MLPAQVVVLQNNSQRDQGRRSQLRNISAGKNVAEILRTTLGPKAMLKMLLDPMGGIVITNDGNSILREVDVAHPAAKSIIELSRAIDEEVGDGTTSVVVLAGELLAAAEPLLQRNIHPTIIVAGYLKALEDSVKIMEEIAYRIDTNDDKAVIEVIDSCLNTKFCSRWGQLISKMAIDAVKSVMTVNTNGRKEIDIKRYAKVEKIPGGEIEESIVLSGVVVNKDVVHPKMKRLILNPRIIALDCPLEYKKGESQTNVEVKNEADWMELLKQEENEVEQMCNEIIATGCNVVITEKGVSDLAQHFLLKAGISVIRRVRKSDNNRIARVTGAKIVSRPEELCADDVGMNCDKFEIKKIGDDYFCFLTGNKSGAACSIILRGASKDVLNEVERNLQDAMCVAKSIMLDPALLPGGGATEMEIGSRLTKKSSDIEGASIWSYKALAGALEVIPRTLCQNCGANVIRVITDLRARHAEGGNKAIGVDGNKGVICDVSTIGVWDTLSVKRQVYNTAVEAASMLLRIDDVISGIVRKKNAGGNPAMANQPGGQEHMETFGDSRDG